MATKGDPGDGSNGDDIELKKKERELLSKVVLEKFTATPKTVPTFGSVALAWEVTLPEDPVFDITVTLNKAAVPPQGSASRSLFQPTFFTLAAVTEHAGRLLRSLNSPESGSPMIGGFLSDVRPSTATLSLRNS